MFEVLTYIGLGYGIGSFIMYFPIEYNYMQELFSMTYLPDLLINK
jgi:hypothetical protein